MSEQGPEKPPSGPAAPGTQAEVDFERTKRDLERLGVWEGGSSAKQWHDAAIMALSVVHGNNRAEGEKAKLEFILAKNFDDAIDRMVAATRDLVRESHDNTDTMSRLQRWMIGITIVYVVTTAVGVYFARHASAPVISVQPAPVQVLQPSLPDSSLPPPHSPAEGAAPSAKP